MSCTSTQIINQAKSWIGCKESDGSHKKIIDVYNSQKSLARGYKAKYTDSWCAIFVSACAVKCNATDIIPTECSCGNMITLMKNKGIWIEDDNITPKKGDIIFYDWDKKDGWPEHVGIVEKVSGKTITVIEGNKSNAVGRRTITVGNASIRGYGRPKYKSESSSGSSGSSSYYPKYSGSTDSIVTALNSIGVNSSYSNREKIAKANGISGYSGTASQNTKMLNLLKQGKLKKVGSSSSSTSYYKKYTGKSNSIVDALNAIGVNSSYSNREKIAKKNGISNYTGTASQNEKLLSLLKQGKLKK